MGEGSPPWARGRLQRSHGACKDVLEPGGLVVAPCPGESTPSPGVPELPVLRWGPGWLPPTSPLQAALAPSRVEEGCACWGWGGGFRAGTGTRAWACTLRSPDVGPIGPFPARLPRPARRSLPPERRGCRRPRLAQGAPGPSSPSPHPWGPLVSRLLCCPPALSSAPPAPTLLTHRVLGGPHWPLARGSGARPRLGGKATSGALLQPLGSSRSRGALGRRMAGPQGLGGQGQRAVAMPTAEHAHPWPWAESGAVSAS